ncbi:MFS transporter [Roseicella frigidaeris]|uniref:MFS transporter n=1 Tax=Roseicella frigidaeris TaxID=2230885 RepID=A0A327MA20_9PROT|nr:MFS transporter [Roseicella frigidaeris]RAI59609.1 MFS transporter [Roseicella frigidaeris]
MDPARRLAPRLPFYYGWVVIAVAFVTMGVAVSARTAFSLLLPPLLDEFGWERGIVAGAFSFGFLVSAVLSPVAGRAVDRQGPRFVICIGVCMMAAGLLLAPMIVAPWHLYATLGVLVGAGTNLMGFTVQSLYLPNWFVRRRAMAIGLAFAGVGAGAVVLLPWFQAAIDRDGWRAACRAMGLLVLVVIGPLALLVRRRPEDIGLLPDGAARAAGPAGSRRGANIVDPAWASVEWTLAKAVRTGRFWWIALGYSCALFAWYAVQVHQTKYLVEIGLSPAVGAWALGIVAVVAIPGQIGLGALSDRIGREWVWSIGCLGFAVCYATLIALGHVPSPALLWVMVLSQGLLGYALTSVMGPIVAEIFEGPHFGTIFGTLNVAMIAGGAAGPWVAGAVHDATGRYDLSFLLAVLLCVVSAAAIWIAAPRGVRLVPGRAAA